LILCSAGLVVSNWMVAQEQSKTQAALKNEKQRAADARRAVDLLVDVSEQELAELPMAQSIRKRLLVTALSYYQDFIDTHAGDSSAQADLEAGRKRIRAILDELATLEGANLLFLATDPEVQEDIDISDEQREQLAGLKERSWELYRTQFLEKSLTSEARRQKFYELAKAQEAALADILDAQKLQRLRQIELQMQGPRAFHESYLEQELKLTADQKRKIREFRDETMVVVRISPPGSGPEFVPKSPPGQVRKPPFEKGGPKGEKGFRGDPERMAQIEKARAVELERILAILTPQQKARWQELIGVPYQGRMRMFLRFGGPKGPPLQ
jgi:hypothetical protein